MANDILCPNCNQPNPPNALRCLKCDTPFEDDSDSWLERLRKSSEEPGYTLKPDSPPADTPPSDETPIEIREDLGEATEPNWLHRVRARNRADEDASIIPDWLQPGGSAQSATQPGETPDWLSQVKQEQEPPASNGEAGWDSSQRAEWLSNLNSGTLPEAGASSEAPTSPATPQTASPTTPAFQADGDDDWLNILRSTAQPSTFEGEASPDGLDGAQAEPPVVLANELPDWLGVTPSEPPAAPSTAASSSDWMSAAGEDQPTVPAQSMTDWLNAVTPQESAATSPSGDSLDWLNASEAELPPASAQSLSDWINAVDSQPAATPETPQKETSTPFAEENVPARLTGVPPGESEPLPSAFISTPDWLNQIAPAQPPQLTDSSAFSQELPGLPPPSDQDSPPRDAFVGSELPDWLGATPTEAEKPAQSTPRPRGVGPLVFADQPLPDWLENVQPEEEKPLTPASEVGAEFKPETAPPAEEGEPIAQGEVPEWVSAMRPVDMVAPEPVSAAAEDQPPVRTGPLAGLRGLVNGEELVTYVVKPPTYSTKLRVTEKQRTHATLLEDVVMGETRPREAQPETAQTSQRLLRMMVGFALILVVLLVNLLSGTPKASNGPFPLDVVRFLNVIQALPVNAPVLVGVEFEPGLSVELTVSASQVMTQLVDRQARLVFISTVSTGPALTDGLLKAGMSNTATLYDPSQKMVNLGYLAGGVASLQEFVLRPMQAAPFAIDSTVSGEFAWAKPALAGLSTLRDFACVIIITDNADTGRMWIEQVQPALKGAPAQNGNPAVSAIPLVLVSSAQSAPMLQPYVQGGQVQGMISGVMGANAYEQLQQQIGSASKLGLTLQTVVVSGAVLVVLGMLLQGIVALFSGRKSKRNA